MHHGQTCLLMNRRPARFAESRRAGRLT